MKTNLIDQAMLYVSPERAEKRIRARARSNIMLARAAYDGAGSGRRWFRGSSTSQNAENRRAIQHLRNAVRELERNNPYMSIAYDVIQSTTIGKGIKPKAKHPTNKRKQKKAQSLLDEWANTNAIDWNGKLDLYGLQSLSMRSIAASGESLFVKRIVRDKRTPVPLRLQLLEGDFIDEQKDAAVNVGHSNLVQGVELVNGRPNRYHLFDRHPGDVGVSVGMSKPNSANIVAHGFNVLRPGQVRGIPWGYAALTKMKGLDDFQDARIEQQRMAACFVGAVYSEEGKDAGDPLPSHLEPGIMTKLSGGENIAFNTPPSVSGQDAFVRGEERLIASCLGITYESLTGDYSMVNFASGKMARIQMFSNVDRWRSHIIIPQQLKTVGEWFLEAATLVGHDMAGVTIDWTPPKKEILDLKNELPGIIGEVRSGLNSLQGALRERGTDIETVLLEIQEDQALLDQFSIVLDTDPRKTNKSGQLQQVTSHNSEESTPHETEENTDA